MKQHSLSLLQERIAGSESAQLAESVAATQGELEEAKAAAVAAQQKMQDMHKAAQVSSPSLTVAKVTRLRACCMLMVALEPTTFVAKQQTLITQDCNIVHHKSAVPNLASVCLMVSKHGSYTIACNVNLSIARLSTL